ncbi:hypothetical protein HWV62_7692 [Athelia sp. TMB]|nr:hypothetical protein HWV62_7692 [Athelia sp. TMB]
MRDILPQALPPATDPADIELVPPPETSPDPEPSPDSGPMPTAAGPVDSVPVELFRTCRNIFGLFRKYFSSNRPSHDPEEFVGLIQLSDDLASVYSVEEDQSQANVGPHAENTPTFAPYPNKTAYQLGQWYWDSAQKSQKSFNELIGIIGSPEYRPEHVRDIPWTKINNILASDSTEVEWLDEVAGWTRTPIKIMVPFHQRTSSPGQKPYIAGDLFHRSLVSVLREKFTDPENAQGLHYEPFELFWQPGDEGTKTRVHGELYTSRSFAREHQQLMDSPKELNCNLPRAIAAIMLPDSFKDFVSHHTLGKGMSQKFMTHCRRELLHAQWELLLDDDFIMAYQHGIVVECGDGVTRRIYPRVFTYSADYPEKLGTVPDMKRRKQAARLDDTIKQAKVSQARDLIYNKNLAVDNVDVENLLKEESLVPTDNAFSKRLARFGFNIFLALVIDLMHEFELGVWRALFIHLLRMLEAHDKSLVMELDRRLVPTFGRATIRRFSSNVSELKKLAARDYEDILQWHAFAKLRMHTDHTLNIMDAETTRLGREFRAFVKNTCAAFQTKELKRETAARQRRQVKKLVKSGQKLPEVTSAEASSADTPEARLPKTLNIQTIKFHLLGDHVEAIREFGTNDSHSTEPGELEHRTSKSRYPRTSHKYFTRQLAGIDLRANRLRRLRAHLRLTSKLPKERIPKTFDEHHHIGISENRPVHINTFASADPSTKNFAAKLKEHLLLRFIGVNEGELDIGDSPRILLKRDRIYEHAFCRINYTTYDVRREQESINADSSHCNIMVLSSEAGSDSSQERMSYRYGKVLGVYHANVIFLGKGMVDYTPVRMEFLWVRWYELVAGNHSAWDARKLDRLQFPPLAHDSSFGFVNPDDVLRGCHVIPAFSQGKRHIEGKGMSLRAKDASDWKEYFLNRFVDRDIFMRYYAGLAVGHKYAWSQTLATPADSKSSSHLSTLEEDDLLVDREIHAQEETMLNDAESINSMDRGLGLSDDESDDGGVVISAAEASEADFELDDEELCAHHEMYDAE